MLLSDVAGAVRLRGRLPDVSDSQGLRDAQTLHVHLVESDHLVPRALPQLLRQDVRAQAGRPDGEDEDAVIPHSVMCPSNCNNVESAPNCCLLVISDARKHIVRTNLT